MKEVVIFRYLLQISKPDNKMFKKQNKQGWTFAKIYKTIEAEMEGNSEPTSQRAIMLFLEKLRNRGIIKLNTEKTDEYKSRHNNSKEIYDIDYRKAHRELLQDSEVYKIVKENYTIIDNDISF